jgi:hypothetical protein
MSTGDSIPENELTVVQVPMAKALSPWRLKKEFLLELMKFQTLSLLINVCFLTLSGV